MVKSKKPLLLIGSPMCTAFSTWQWIGDRIRCPMIVAVEKWRAVEHFGFCIELYREQMRHGRCFVHGHPVCASSRQDEEMRKLIDEPIVEKATADHCQYGSAAAEGSSVKKSLTFLTNSPERTKELKARCVGKQGQCSRPEQGKHTQCRGKTARAAAVYDFKFSGAICLGFRNQSKRDATYMDGFIGSG